MNPLFFDLQQFDLGSSADERVNDFLD